VNEVVWSAIGAGTLFGLSGGFSPGPLLVLVISETLRHGLRVGIMVAITPLLTDFPVMLVAILLLNQLTHFDLLLGGISLAGAVFLLRIGWLSLKTAPIIPGEGEVRPHSIGTRMMTNYLNPSMYLFWFTVGAPFWSARAVPISGPESSSPSPSMYRSLEQKVWWRWGSAVQAD